jgi:hypothetical protein
VFRVQSFISRCNVREKNRVDRRCHRSKESSLIAWLHQHRGTPADRPCERARAEEPRRDRRKRHTKGGNSLDAVMGAAWRGKPLTHVQLTELGYHDARSSVGERERTPLGAVRSKRGPAARARVRRKTLEADMLSHRGKPTTPPSAKIGDSGLPANLSANLMCRSGLLALVRVWSMFSMAR